jgi:hypothetical protein
MKHWGKITGAIFIVLLAFTSLQVQAASKADREFNHMSTGFPLTGVHATTTCESCHAGGIFVGTPRACDGCHAVGKRVVATPKSTKHIVTDAPCETCHFNASTFYGARFNHGTAVPGQCENCHNGHITTGKPSAHPVTMSACDNCHRTSSWLPASWNHRDTVSDCSTCHKAGGPGRDYNHTSHLPMSMDTVTFTGNCKACHNNYYTFYSAYYNHGGASTSCGNCHQFAAYGPGVKQIVSTAKHSNFAAALITQCTSCHKSYGVGTFLAGRYDHTGAMPATCGNCHAGHATWAADITQMSSAAGNIHPAATTVGIITGTSGCEACHTASYSVWTGRYTHADAAYTAKMAVNSCAGCHNGTALPIKSIPANHTNAFGAGLVTTPSGPSSCNACHTTFTSWTQMNHAALTMLGGCKKCHDSGLNPGLYFANMEKKSNGHKGYNQATQDCISCHANQYNRWNHP